MKATVYYTNKVASGFGYNGNNEDPKIDVKVYDYDGNFVYRDEVTPNLRNHYTKVGKVEFPLGSLRSQPENVDEFIPSPHLDAVYGFFNSVKPSEITEKIKSGELNVSHSSMSVGDIIEIDGHFFIVANMGFDRITNVIKNG